MSKKISFSFLGTGAYKATKYFFPGAQSDSTYATPLVQLAIQEYLEEHQGFNFKDRHVLLLTDDARNRNYLAAVKPYDEEVAAHAGLKIELAHKEYKSPTKPLFVPSGHDRDSIIDIFDTIVNEVSHGDEVYLDITHGFRSLPILAVVLANFLRVAKGAHTKAIYYGAFEDRDNYNGRAPIYDLSYFIELQEWSTATYGYVNYGFVEPLLRLSSGETSTLLRNSKGQNPGAKAVSQLIKSAHELAKQIRTNRGYELYQGTSATNIAEQADNLSGDSIIERGPIPLLMDKIASKSVALQKQGTLNWLHAARLAYDDGLIQQTCSLLREGTVSYVCKLNDRNPGSAHDRRLTEKALNIAGRKVDREKWDLEGQDLATVEVILKSQIVQTVKNPFAALTPYRDDLMHAGYYTEEEDNNARKSDRIINAIEKILLDLERQLLHS